MTVEEPTFTESDFFSLMFDPEVVRCIEFVRTVTFFELPNGRRSAFRRFHAFATDPQPDYIKRWRSAPDTERFYQAHVDGILTHAQSGLAAAHYHAQRLAEMEALVGAYLSKSAFAETMPANHSLTLGATPKLDYEYQAFVLACRRTLDYLAGGLAAYFKTSARNFRKLPRGLGRAIDSPVGQALVAVHSRHLAPLDFILDEGPDSLRNRIAHHEHVTAAHIVLTPRGFFLATGDGALRFGAAPLGEQLTKWLDALHLCVDEMIDAFVEAARTAQPAPSQRPPIGG